jgi:hypothetical protein
MKWLSVSVLVVVTVLGLAQGAVLDQAQEQMSSYTTIDIWGSSYVQTFTCGITGQLDHIDVRIVGEGGVGDPGYPTTVAIVNVVAGEPVMPPIAQIDSVIFELGWNSVDFVPVSVFLTSGTQYGIMLANDDTTVSDEPTANLCMKTGYGVDSYAGGSLWKGDPGSWEEDWLEPHIPGSSPLDACFRTYMVADLRGVVIDIKPRSCPNPLNLRSKGVVPAAVLGSDALDVNSIDIASVRLEGVAPVRSSIEDVSAVVADGNECECTTEGPDGYDDLTLKFKTWEIAEAIGPVAKGDTLALTLTGTLTDGTPIGGSDCIVIVGNVPRALAARKADVTGDGVVDMLDVGTIAQYWLESCIIDY